MGRLKSLGTKDISQFLFANAMYSLSTGLISILSPYLLRDSKTYEDFIYIFQNVMYLTSLFTAGLNVALLRFYKYNHAKYDFFFSLVVSVIICGIFLLGFFENNILTDWLNLKPSSFLEHLFIYISVCFSLMYIFNRAALTAKEKYKKIAFDISIIFVLRIIALYIVAIVGISNLSLVLLIVCILPFFNEFLVFTKRLTTLKWGSLEGLREFIFFSLKIAIIGILFLTSNRLLVIAVKSYDNSLAASLSFANGLIGIISILNTTLSSYFIGKLDYKNVASITVYLKKVRRFTLPFFVLLALVAAVGFAFVEVSYPDNATVTAWICAITICQSGIIFFLGLVTLLAKTYNCLNVQLAVNVLVCIAVYLVVHTLTLHLDIIPKYLLVNLTIILGEVCLMGYVLRRHSLQEKAAVAP